MADENFYDGASYPLEPEQGEVITGYYVPAVNIGMATDPRTADQLKAASDKVSTGARVIEVSQAFHPRIFEAMPDPWLDEIRRLSKLTGTEITFHGPAIEASGYTEAGWSEANREFAENQILATVERSHKMSDKGNIPVTFHPAYMLPEGEVRVKEKEGEVFKSRVLYVDPRTGEVGQIREIKRFFPEEEKELMKEFKPELEIAKFNKERWARILNDLNFYAARGEEDVRAALRGMSEEAREAEIPPEKIQELRERLMKAYARAEEAEKLSPREREIFSIFSRSLDRANIFLRDSYNMLRELYNRVYPDASPEDKKKLIAYVNEIKARAEAGIERDPEKMREFAEMIREGVKTLGEIKEPKIFQPLNKWLTDKTSETFSNVALKAYEKFGDKAPVLSIENAPIGTALSRADDLKELIEETRKRFVKKAMEEGFSRGKAERAAEKLIGATWDVGHINMLRKYGYDKVDIAKEAEKIAPLLKHVHLSDNFGYEHTELPMGMGTVPMKEIMKKLGKKGQEVKKIIEAGDWYQFFKTPPLRETYETLKVPLVQKKYWHQITGTRGTYFAGYGDILPEVYTRAYGPAGWAGMPATMGGQMPGARGRFAGTPTA